MVDRLQLAAFAGCNTKSAEEFEFNIGHIYVTIHPAFFYIFQRLIFITLSIEILTKIPQK